MKDTKIRWANDTWNPMTGCSEISPGCDHCYARVIAEKFKGSAFPNGFEPTFKPKKLTQPEQWREPRRIFANSMSDIHHEDFTVEQIDAVYDAMLKSPKHDFLVLTKRPQRMARYILGTEAQQGWLQRRGLNTLPEQIWVGTTVENDRYTFRANYLRQIPALVRFLSCEPLLGPLPSLDLTGIGWVIAGGESGNGSKNFRPMDLDWPRDLRDRCNDQSIAFYYKQGAATRTEMFTTLDGETHEEYPLPHPSLHLQERTLGIYLDATLS